MSPSRVLWQEGNVSGIDFAGLPPIKDMVSGSEQSPNRHINNVKETFSKQFLEYIPGWIQILDQNFSQYRELTQDPLYNEFMLRKLKQISEQRIEMAPDHEAPPGFTKENVSLFQRLIALQHEQENYLKFIMDSVVAWRKNLGELIAYYSQQNVLEPQLEQLKEWNRALGDLAEINLLHAPQDQVLGALQGFAESLKLGSNENLQIDHL